MSTEVEEEGWEVAVVPCVGDSESEFVSIYMRACISGNGLWSCVGGSGVMHEIASSILERTGVLPDGCHDEIDVRNPAKDVP